MFKKTAQTIGDLVANRVLHTTPLLHHTILAAYDSIAPAPAPQKFIRANTLFVKVPNPELRHNLRMQQHTLLSQLHTLLPAAATITTIRFY